MRTVSAIILLLTALLAFGWSALPAPHADTAADGAVLLAARVRPGADGLDLAFRMPRPGRVLIRVTGPEGRPARVEVGPPLPVRERTGTWRPAATRAFTVEARGQAQEEHVLHAVGTYVVRVEPVPSAMECTPDEVVVEVRLLPERRAQPSEASSSGASSSGASAGGAPSS